MIDLDAQRAARAEATKSAPVVKFGGIEYTLPAEMPFEVLEAFRGLQDADTAPVAIANIARAFFGSRYAEFLASGPSVEDVNTLIQAVMAEYGVEAPLEPSAS